MFQAKQFEIDVKGLLKLYIPRYLLATDPLINKKKAAEKDPNFPKDVTPPRVECKMSRFVVD